MRGIPIHERLFQQPFALGPRAFFRHAHQLHSPAMALSYCRDYAPVKNTRCRLSKRILSPRPFTKGGMMGLLLAFCQNVGNISRKPGQRRIPQDKLIATWNSLLSSAEPSRLSFVDYFRHTENYVVRASGIDSVYEVTQLLAQHIPSYSFAVFEYHDFVRIRKEADQAVEPSQLLMSDRRCTPGFVMNLDPQASIPLALPPTGKFRIGSFGALRIRNAWKNDILSADGLTLDRTRREGGWGGLATYFRTQCGGSWTARSMTTIEGLLQKAKHYEARGV